MKLVHIDENGLIRFILSFNMTLDNTPSHPVDKVMQLFGVTLFISSYLDTYANIKVLAVQQFIA